MCPESAARIRTRIVAPPGRGGPSGSRPSWTAGELFGVEAAFAPAVRGSALKLKYNRFQ